MDKNTKTILSFIVVILLLGFGFYFFSKKQNADDLRVSVPVETSSIQEGEERMEHFTDAGNTFTFDYNSLFSINDGTVGWGEYSGQGGVLLASVSIPTTYMPNTNFSAAYLTIGMSGNVNAIKTCITADETRNEKKVESVTVNGFPFTRFTLSDAGAGNFYETTSYRGIVDGDCYAIEYTIHSTNIGNYSPDQGIKEFDKSKIENELEKIVKSFRFLVHSD